MLQYLNIHSIEVGVGVIVVETVGIFFRRWCVIVVNVVPHVPHLGYNLCSVATAQ